ncbi:hypothetical protein D9M70_594620 [compost metagenome]
MQCSSGKQIRIVTFDDQALVVNVDIFLDLRANKIQEQCAMPIGISHQILGIGKRLDTAAEF